MTRLVPALGMILATATVSAAPVPVIPADPLPQGATARLGSLAFRGPSLNGLSFSPDGKTLRAVSGWQVYAWDAASGRLLHQADLTPKGVDGLTETTMIAGNRLIWIGTKGVAGVGKIADNNTVVVTDFVRGEMCRFTFTGYPFPGFLDTATPVWMTKAAVTPDGKHLAIWADGDKTLRVYDLDSGKQLHALKIDATHGPGVHVSPNGKTAYFQEFQKPIRRCDLESGKLLPDLGMTDFASARIEAMPDGKRVVIRNHYVSFDKVGRRISHPDHSGLTVWDLAGNQAVGKVAVGVTAEHFKFAGPDALLVLAANYRPPLPTLFTVSRWNIDTLKQEWEMPCPAADWLAVSPDGKRFVITDRRHTAHLYDAATGKSALLSGSHDGPITWVGFSPDGGTITTADQRAICNWDLKGGKKEITTGKDLGRGPGALTCLGDRLVWVIPADAGKPAELVGWDLAKSVIGWRMPLDGKTPDRVCSHDGKRVVGLTWDAKQKMWDVIVYDEPGGKKLHAWTMKNIPVWDDPWPVAFFDNGRSLYVGCKDGVVGLDVLTGKEITRVDTGWVHGNGLHQPFRLAATADGSRIALVPNPASVEGNKDLLRVFDVKSGKTIVQHALELPKFLGGVHFGTGVKFSPDGKRVAVWSGLGTKVLVCDAESDAKPRVLDGGLSRPTAVAFSPNNADLVVGYQDGTALVWDLAKK